MSYVRFMNEANPLWDFISEMAGQEQGPFDRRQRGPPRGSWGWSPFDEETEHGPWSRDMPHRPHHPPHPSHGRGRGGRGPPGGPPRRPHNGPHHGPPPPPLDTNEDNRSATFGNEPEEPINLIDNDDDNNAPAPDPEISTPAEQTSGEEDDIYNEHEQRGWHDHHRHGRHGPHHGPGGFRRRGGFGGCGRGGMRAYREAGGRGFWGPRPWGFSGRHHPYAHPNHQQGDSDAVPPAGPAGAGLPFAHFANMFGVDLANFDPERMREAFADALQNAASTVHPSGNRTRGENNTNSQDNEGETKNKDVDFRPSADIYDAHNEYVVHFALPGAKKEDINLNWDAEKRELHVTGVIAREGDEEVMKTLALDERDVGLFERKVKLGRENVDADGITARMENGLLVVKVPKRVEDEWTEVMKVDIE